MGKIKSLQLEVADSSTRLSQRIENDPSLMIELTMKLNAIWVVVDRINIMNGLGYNSENYLKLPNDFSIALRASETQHRLMQMVLDDPEWKDYSDYARKECAESLDVSVGIYKL
jgi:hypothetical protein